jgi:hypothetical protein
MERQNILQELINYLSSRTAYRFVLKGNSNCSILEANIDGFCYVLALCSQVIGCNDAFIFNLSCRYGEREVVVNELTELSEKDVKEMAAYFQDFLLKQIVVVCYVNRITGGNITAFSWPHLKCSTHLGSRVLYKEMRRITINPKRGF